MAHNTVPMLTDRQGKIIPQIYDPVTDSYKPLTTDVYNNIDIKTMPVKTVKRYIEGEKSQTLTFNEKMTGISVANDGLEQLKITISNVTRTIYAGEVYNADLDGFTTLTVNATDKYRIEVLA